MMPDLETLALLESLKARLIAAQLLAAGSSAWGAIRRITLDLERTIAAAHAERDRWAEETMAKENDYFIEEGGQRTEDERTYQQEIGLRCLPE